MTEKEKPLLPGSDSSGPEDEAISGILSKGDGK
jgi:hypothetical protein